MLGATRYLVFETRQRVRYGFPHLRLVSGCFTRPTGDLGLQLCRRIDHVETRSPPYVFTVIPCQTSVWLGPTHCSLDPWSRFVQSASSWSRCLPISSKRCSTSGGQRPRRS